MALAEWGILPHRVEDELSYEQLQVLLDARARRKRSEQRWEHERLRLQLLPFGVKLKPMRAAPAEPPTPEALDRQLAAAASRGIEITDAPPSGDKPPRSAS